MGFLSMKSIHACVYVNEEGVGFVVINWRVLVKKIRQEKGRSGRPLYLFCNYLVG